MALFSFTWLLLPFESTTFPQLYILAPSLCIGITSIEAEVAPDFIFPGKESSEVIRSKMNPLVKVKAQDDQFSPRNDTGLLLFLRTINTLSMQAEDYQSHSPSPVDRITKIHVPNIQTQSSPMSQGTMKNNVRHISNSKSNVRANSVLRPRAVLSSPGNLIYIVVWMCVCMYSNYTDQKHRLGFSNLRAEFRRSKEHLI
ncbi:uncharacterized protein LOC121248072 isoform X2 [Juglans microcarpa x Juglans regia]|uniref:uncharacterized protein LOC121248072 isoform X2 n=1 Tax=Juglans microcarpa x Juglans regia TaxID=2249226 RepID=UPI001B7F5DF5|nr:uncharacterized protein LOC121248072 isoform X2 [Juglans microcarpa x Juglans regia]